MIVISLILLSPAHIASVSKRCHLSNPPPSLHPRLPSQLRGPDAPHRLSPCLPSIRRPLWTTPQRPTRPAFLEEEGEEEVVVEVEVEAEAEASARIPHLPHLL